MTHTQLGFCLLNGGHVPLLTSGEMLNMKEYERNVYEKCAQGDPNAQLNKYIAYQDVRISERTLGFCSDSSAREI